MELNKKTISIVAVLLVLTVGLLYIDYSSSHKGGSPSFFSSVVRSILRPSMITDEVLTKGGFKAGSLVTGDQSSDFFAPYLKLPDNVTASTYTLDNTITVYVVDSAGSTFDMVKVLTGQASAAGDYQFNIINSGTFYLNQTPASKKTHNFLGLVINNVLYGFQYPAIRHQDVLRLIDSLQNKP